MDSTSERVYQFDRADLDALRLAVSLAVGQRVRRLLNARSLAVGLIRGRLQRQYPDLDARALNLKVLEELARADRCFPRSEPVFRHPPDA